tara:strand:+ start:124 stop:501 length:378 start_codon:yes stop_codon:yes gene_type:complete
MYRKGLLIFLAILIIGYQLFRKNFFKFDTLMKNGFKAKGLLTRRDSLYLVAAIKKVSRLTGINSCFTRTLCLRTALTLSNFELKIFIGVREEDGKVLSHCWVETRDFNIEDSNENKLFSVIKEYS